MTDTDNRHDDSDSELDDILDQVSEKVADSLISKLLRWFIRTIIGLELLGVLWHYFDWASWLFWGYTVLASISLILTIYLHFRLVDIIGGRLVEQGDADGSTSSTTDL